MRLRDFMYPTTGCERDKCNDVDRHSATARRRHDRSESTRSISQQE
jgi:hypothetical protein